MQGSIKVKVIKESPTTVTIQFVSSNSSMPVGKEDFDKRVKNGTYEVIK